MTVTSTTERRLERKRAHLLELVNVRVGRHVRVARSDRLVDCAVEVQEQPVSLGCVTAGRSEGGQVEEDDALKMTLAYSFQAPSASTSLPSPLGTRRKGPTSMRPPSNDEQPGPPLNLLQDERQSVVRVERDEQGGRESEEERERERDGPEEGALRVGDVLVANHEEEQVGVRVRVLDAELGRGRGDVAAVHGDLDVVGLTGERGDEEAGGAHVCGRGVQAGQLL